MCTCKMKPKTKSATPFQTLIIIDGSVWKQDKKSSSHADNYNLTLLHHAQTQMRNSSWKQQGKEYVKWGFFGLGQAVSSVMNSSYWNGSEKTKKTSLLHWMTMLKEDSLPKAPQARLPGETQEVILCCHHPPEGGFSSLLAVQQEWEES